MGKVRKWSQENMEKAVRRVQLGELSLRNASRDYAVPRATLHERVVKKRPLVTKPGPSPVLTASEEDLLENWLKQMCRIGMGQNREDLKNTVKNILDKDGRPNPFPKNRPGNKWFRGFMTRHPTLSVRTTQAIGKKRAVVTPNTINKWYERFESYLREHKALSILEDGRRMFNCDESGFAIGGKSKTRVLAEKGSKIVQEVKNTDKSQITVLATVNAAGSFLPPFIILPGRRVSNGNEHMVGAPVGTFFTKTENGWIDSKSFHDFLERFFNPYITAEGIPRPVLLFLDGHSTHQTYDVAEFGKKNGILLYRLPPNSTHLLQPCDISVFKSLKSGWYKAEREYRFENPDEFVTKRTFARVFAKPWEATAQKPSLAINGFKAAGLFPFTKQYRLEHLVPSSIYNFVHAEGEIITSVEDEDLVPSDDAEVIIASVADDQ